MFGSSSEYICACWNGAHPAVRRQHEDRDAALAAHRVLRRRAGVAGRGAEDVDASRPPRASTYSNSSPSSCSAMSLNASVGPFDARSRCRPGSSVASGVMSSLPNALRRVGAIDDRAEIVGRDVVDELREYHVGEPAVVERAQRGELGRRKPRYDCGTASPPSGARPSSRIDEKALRRGGPRTAGGDVFQPTSRLRNHRNHSTSMTRPISALCQPKQHLAPRRRGRCPTTLRRSTRSSFMSSAT